jgi:glutathione-regulated potassium-efflux system ancillary protein KefC
VDQVFLSQALIYLAAAVIAVPLFKRLGLGAVLGFLVAGIVIGPWGLGLISDVAAILQFGELGVVLLLFLLGLELEPKRLLTMRGAVFGLGTAHIVGTLLAVAVLGVALGHTIGLGVVAGMGLAMSSTAIALTTLSEKGLLPSAGGQAAFAVLLAQDLAVIPLLLIIGMMTPGADNDFDAMAALKAIAAVIAVIVGGRTLLRPLLRYIANTKLREIFIAFALLLVIGIAMLMEWVGLSMALGTFLAGVLLADSEYRHELVLDIEPFKGLLLGLFFIAVGMSVDIGLFLRVPAVVLSVALGIVTLKIALGYVLARLSKLPRLDAVLFALVLSQVGEFAFVLFGVAGTQGLLSRDAVNVLNAAVATSMLTTPLLMWVHERLIVPRLCRPAERPADVIEERNPIIIAGFGRFGQIVARVLQGRHIGTTIIDHDPNQIELVRRFGWKAYYGDITRLDLLEAAGAAHATLLVIAIDDPTAARKAVALVRERYPQLGLLVRAHGRTDAYEYAELGIAHVRETFGSAVEAAEYALRACGMEADVAHRLVQRFRRHDEESLVRLAPARHDQQQLIAMSQQGMRDLEQLLRDESARLPDAEEGEER